MTVPQVSQLFADHPDLLMEFTYFLPDAVQEQVSEAESEGR
jgi:paired amphipathic helix protein Sin3a